jgi:hypothetical protein
MRRSPIVLLAAVLASALALSGCGAGGEGRPPITTVPGVTAQTDVGADEGEPSEDEAEEEKDEEGEKSKGRGKAYGHRKGEKKSKGE